jgi:hypothetical protein
MGREVPHLTRPPSEYIKRNFWYTTQPMEEPPQPELLRRTFDWVGWDRLLFSSDYPHWDQDDPSYAFNMKMTPQSAANLPPMQNAPQALIMAKRKSRAGERYPAGSSQGGDCSWPGNRCLQREG